VVFLLDEFDTLCQALPPTSFTGLRALRDDHKYQLMYIVAARQLLSQVRQNSSEIEAFEELITAHIIWLGSYSAADARFVLQRISTRYHHSLEEEAIQLLLSQTGGHPGLLQRAFLLACQQNGDLLEAMDADISTQDECQRIWQCLSKDEQRILSNTASGRPSSQPVAVFERLRQKGMLGGDWSPPDDIFSPVLNRYIRQKQPVVGARITIDRKGRSIYLDGRKIGELAPLEFRFIEYLEAKRGQVCTRDELAQHLYPDDMSESGQGVADSRIDAVVKRLRKLLEPDPNQPQFILTVRGHGFKLVDGESAQ
jgi:DNA-binding winged helix-turn-helix (wHTH) protein